nr:DUF5330 domain-containing protein [uncultured Cohaesibacter sp.]
MSFLIRAAFWLSLVILILPAEPDSKRSDASLSTTQAISAAQAALSDFTSFCSRQPDVCAAGEVALDNFAAKARYGAKQLYVYLDDDSGEKDTEAQTKLALTESPDRSSLDQKQLTTLVNDLQQ